MAAKDELGARGERIAERHLVRRGLTLLDRNWRCPQGEIDLVLRDGDELVFVEVKTRSSVAFGHPLEAITAAKLARLRRLAGAWCEAHPGGGPHPHRRGRGHRAARSARDHRAPRAGVLMGRSASRPRDLAPRARGSGRRDRGGHLEQPARRSCSSDCPMPRSARRATGCGRRPATRACRCRRASSRSTCRRRRCPSTAPASTSGSRWPRSRPTGRSRPSRSTASCTSASSGSTVGCGRSPASCPRCSPPCARVSTRCWCRRATPTRRRSCPASASSPVISLRDAAIWHGAELEPIPLDALMPTVPAPALDDAGDLADVIGNPDAVEAMQVAAAGGHHVFLLGPPGAGKTMLASRLPGLLPDLSAEEALEVTSIRSLAGIPVRGGLSTATAARGAAPHGDRGGDRRRRQRGDPAGRRGARVPRRAVPRRGAGVRARRARRAAAAARVGRHHDLAGERDRALPGAVPARARREPVPVRQRGRARRRLPLHAVRACAATSARLSGPLLDRIDIRWTCSASPRRSCGCATERPRLDTAAARARILAGSGRGGRRVCATTPVAPQRARPRRLAALAGRSSRDRGDRRARPRAGARRHHDARLRPRASARVDAGRPRRHRPPRRRPRRSGALSAERRARMTILGLGRVDGRTAGPSAQPRRCRTRSRRDRGALRPRRVERHRRAG